MLREMFKQADIPTCTFEILIVQVWDSYRFRIHKDCGTFWT